MTYIPYYISNREYVVSNFIITIITKKTTMNLVNKTQEGLLSDPTPFVEYLTLELKQDKFEVDLVISVIDKF
jgi:hypothetical protein